MMKVIFVFVCIISLSLTTAYAKSLELKRNTRSIFIEEKANWKLGKDLFWHAFYLFLT